MVIGLSISNLPSTHHSQFDERRAARRGWWPRIVLVLPWAVCVVGCQLVDSTAWDPVPAAASDSEHRVPTEASSEDSASVAAASQSIQPVSAGNVADETDTGANDAAANVERSVAVGSAAASAPDESAVAGGPLELTLNAALQFALENNRQIRVLSLVPDEVATALPVEEAQFDPTLSTGGQWSAVNQQVESAI